MHYITRHVSMMRFGYTNQFWYFNKKSHVFFIYICSFDMMGGGNKRFQHTYMAIRIDPEHGKSKIINNFNGKLNNIMEKE